MEFRGARQVHERLVKRQRFYVWRQFIHHCPDLTRGFGIDVHARADHHCIRAELGRLKHRHGRTHTPDTGDITSGRHHAPPPAADDDGLVTQLGIVAFLDACVKCIAIHMGDAEVEQLRVPHDAQAPAGGTTPLCVKRGQAIAAKGLHGQEPSTGPRLRERPIRR